MKRFRLTGSLALTALVALTSFSPFAHAESKKIRMGISALSAGYTVAYIAKDTGLFAKNGLDVELILIDSGPTVHALIAGDLSVAGVGASRIVASGLEGSGLRILAATNNRQPYKLIVPTGITEPAQLKGKKVGVGAVGGLDDTSMRLGHSRLGLDPNKDGKIVVAGGKATRFAALTSGAVSAIVIDPPYTLDAKKLGLNVLFDFIESGPKTVYGTVAAKDTYVKQNPEVVRGLLKAMIAATQFYKTNKAKSIEIMAKYMRIELPAKAEEMEETYDAFVKTASCKPYVDPDGVSGLLEQIAIKNPKAAKADPRSFLDMSFIKQLEESGYIDSVCK
jgi:NitT/TauT family transport system substrate-binding protein